MITKKLECKQCGHKWKVTPSTLYIKAQLTRCPICGGERIKTINKVIQVEEKVDKNETNEI